MKGSHGFDPEMQLGRTLQLVLLTEQDRSTSPCSCSGFAGPLLANPTLVILACDGTQAGFGYVKAIRSAVASEVGAWGMKTADVPCGGSVVPWVCHGLNEVTVKKVVVVIGDGSTPLPCGPELAALVGQHQCVVFPAVPETFRSGIAKLLPAPLAGLNALTWKKDPTEIVAEIMNALSFDLFERRIFISYKRDDTSDMADQLFGALSERGFDVFLDRFVIPPGSDIRQKIRQELSDKAFMLVLESQNYSSDWTDMEIRTAKLLRIGQFALSLPKAPHVRTVAQRFQLVDRNLWAGKLEPTALEMVCAELDRQHRRFIVWRRRYLMEVLSRTLMDAGWPGTPKRIKGDTFTHTSRAGNHYLFHMTPRPPTAYDFEAVAMTNSTANKVVMGPRCFSDGRQGAHLDWLSQMSQTVLIAEGSLLRNVRRMP